MVGRARRSAAASMPSTLRRFLLASLAVLLLAAPASAYRFFGRTIDSSLAPIAEGAATWSRSAWGASRTLSWVVSEAPEWSDSFEWRGETYESPFETASDVLPFVRSALDAWSDVRTADIRWRVAAIRANLPRARDHINAIRPHVLDVPASYAAVYIEAGEIMECDISFSPGHTVFFGGRGQPALLHELGHCLGLAHSGMFPTWDSGVFPPAAGAVWPQDPKMSYGYDRDHRLTHDDIIGGSLLRPARGFRHGAIEGGVRFAEASAPFVRLVASRIGADGRLAESVSVFSDEKGRYRFEGLAPGDYLLAAGPMMESSAHGSLLDAGAVLHGAEDRYLLAPVGVSLGASTRAPPIVLREGRASAVRLREEPE